MVSRAAFQKSRELYNTRKGGGIGYSSLFRPWMMAQNYFVSYQPSVMLCIHWALNKN